MADSSVNNGIVKYTSRDYQSILADFLSVIPKLTDLWDGESDADPGMVLAKYLAVSILIFKPEKFMLLQLLNARMLKSFLHFLDMILDFIQQLELKLHLQMLVKKLSRLILDSTELISAHSTHM